MRLRRGIELVKLANRIEALKMQEDDEEDVPGEADMPANAQQAAGEALAQGPFRTRGLKTNEPEKPGDGSAGNRPRSLSKLARGAIFREVVLAKVREMKEEEKRAQIEEQLKTTN